MNGQVSQPAPESYTQIVLSEMIAVLSTSELTEPSCVVGCGYKLHIGLHTRLTAVRPNLRLRIQRHARRSVCFNGNFFAENHAYETDSVVCVRTVDTSQEQLSFF